MLGSGSASRRFAYPVRHTSKSYDAGSVAGALATATSTLDAIDPISRETDFKKCAVKIAKA